MRGPKLRWPRLRSAKIKPPRDLGALTTRAVDREVDPREAGMTREGVSHIWRAVEKLYASGLQPAIALCIRRRGKVVIDRAIGFARGYGPGDPPGELAVPATPETPFCIFSASKAVTAMLIHLLDDKGLIHIDDRVAEYVPEFGCNGKQTMTIRHVLTHRAGIPSVTGPRGGAELLTDWERIVALLSEASPTWRPGRRLAYHAITGGYILGEIVQRVTGRSLRQFLRDEISRPLGLHSFGYGVDEAGLHRVARNYFTGRPVPLALRPMVTRALGVGFEEAVEISNGRDYLTSVVPAGNIVSTAGDVARFYDLLLHEGELGGVRIFQPRTIRRAISESSYLEFDLTLGYPVRYGLGLMLGAKRVSMYGPDTPHAFGHLGFIEMVTWADPDRDIAVALLTSGKTFFGPHLVRLWGVLSAISKHCPREGR